MKWWIALILLIISSVCLLGSILIARYAYKKKEDMWLIALFPIGWSVLFVIVFATLLIFSLANGGTYCG